LLRYSNNTTLAGMPFGPLAIGLGIIALYLLAAVVVSSLFLIDRSSRLWHWLHYLSYVLAAAVFIHVLYTGSDFKSGPARWLWIAGGIVLLAGMISRLWRAGTLRRK
jgi:DMSO/TMAO reductase YedYZ heme-binding membrane subunit